jgi:hypothetical protein
LTRFAVVKLLRVRGNDGVMYLGDFDVPWFAVIPANAGIQMLLIQSPLDSSVHGNDGVIRV